MQTRRRGKQVKAIIKSNHIKDVVIEICALL